MKKDKVVRCPGCSKHCPLSAPRCKYGRTYAAKHPPAVCEKASTGKCKWKSVVAREGLVFQLLSTSRTLKKALCHAEVTEEQLMRVLDEQQQETLRLALRKLADAVETDNP